MKTKVNHLLEYIPPILILSYFMNHNIFLVLISITISLYLINIDMINKIKISISKSLLINKESKDPNKKNKEIESDRINPKSKKEDNNLKLVEEIEKLGFIPSINKNDNSNVA